jgi:HEAT repeat protein
VGLFDKFKDYRKKGDEKRIQKSLAVIKNSKAIKEDRTAAIAYLTDLGDPHAAVPVLLQRFEYSLEHGINDTREKEACLEGIVDYGQDAIPHVREHLLTTSRIAWPIKVLKAFKDDEQVIEILKSALNFEDVRFDQAKVDKNYDILCYLVDYQLPGFVDKVAHFLNDPDERVRFACAELLIEQNDPSVPGYLERFIDDRSSENTRIRQSVIIAFLKHGWKLKDPGRFPEGLIEGPLYVNAEGKLELRQ